MIKVITYGTFDLLHKGHIRLLERAKELGDYLIVGVTADDFDKSRGKINVKQSLIERIESVRATGIADEIIVEEYEGQKIDDIQKYEVDIFTVGSDWNGKFDYLNDYCKVIYLDRTKGISSSEIRSNKRKISLGLVGNKRIINKVKKECSLVNGIDTVEINEENYENEILKVDAVYIVSIPHKHFYHVKTALNLKKHVLCEAPISLTESENNMLYDLADKNRCILMTGIKTAYATAYYRLLLMAKSGKIGDIVSIDATSTSQVDIEKININDTKNVWNSISTWGPTTMLPVFQLLGTDYINKTIVSKLVNEKFDSFTKVDFIYNNAVASIKVGKGVKSEGDLIITGTKGYFYIPSPWWKTDYFEIRYENQNDNKRYFYQLDGEGIRYEFVAFINAIECGKDRGYIGRDISNAITKVIDEFYKRNDFFEIK